MVGRLMAGLGSLLLGVAMIAGANPVEQLERYFAETQTLAGSFVQITRDENGAILEESTGDFVMGRDQRFDWHYQTPWEQRIVSDGEQLWVYDVDLEQVVVRALDEAIGVGRRSSSVAIWLNCVRTSHSVLPPRAKPLC